MAATKAKPRKPAAPRSSPLCLVCRRPVEPHEARDAAAVSGLVAHGPCWERSGAEIAAKADAMPPFATVCEGCGQWVDRIMYRTLDGRRLCGACAPAEVVTTVADATLLKPGESAACWCGLPAVRRCQGCGEAMCDGHWQRHGHKPDGKEAM